MSAPGRGPGSGPVGPGPGSEQGQGSGLSGDNGEPGGAVPGNQVASTGAAWAGSSQDGRAEPGRSTRTVRDVGLWAVERPIDTPVRMSFGALERRVMAVVEVEATDGSSGLGETWANHPTWVLQERSATVACGIRPLLRGAVVDLLDVAGSIAAVQGSLVAALWPRGRQWGAPGAVLQAVSGTDQALWDLAGRLRGQGVCDMAGGRRRARVPVYASGIGPDDVAAQVASCRRMGLTAVKLRVGFDADVDRANLAAARRALGADGELLVDVNQAWSLDTALAMADALTSAGVAWVEEPIADGTLQDWAALHRRTGLAIAVGENVYGRQAWSAVLASPDVAVVQPDVSKQGGITEMLWICARAQELGTVVEPHLYGGALAYAATLQVAACCPVVRRVELDVRPNPVRDGLLVDVPSIVDGEVVVPEGPGLGVRLTVEATRMARASRWSSTTRATRPQPSNVGPSTVGPSTVGPSTVGPSTVGPSNVGPSNVGPSNVGPSTVDPSNRVEPNRVEPNRVVEPSRVVRAAEVCTVAMGRRQAVTRSSMR